MSRHFTAGVLPLIGCAALSLALLAQPQLAAQGFESGVQLCLHSVLPALFPFFVIGELLAGRLPCGALSRRLARLLGLQCEQAATALLLSWVGGYAVCARLVGKLRGSGAISSRDAGLLLLLGCCSSPGFVVGCVGGLLLGNVRLGVLLYALQLAANLLSTALCLPLLPPGEPGIRPPVQTGLAAISLPEALSRAAESCLQVCSCVVFFRMVAGLAAPQLPDLPLTGPLVSGACEISAGCADFAALGGRGALYGCCACLSLLGLSVWMQLALLLRGTVRLGPLLLSRAVHLACFVPLVRLCARFLPGSTAVYRTLADRVVATGRLPPDAALIAFLFLCTALYKLRQNFYNE